MNIPAEQQFKATPSLYIDLGPQLIRYIRELESKLSTHNLRPIQFEHRKRIPGDIQANPPKYSTYETLTLTGLFHQFALEGDGQDIGPVAIIEGSDGQIYTPAAHKCKFLDKSISIEARPDNEQTREEDRISDLQMAAEIASNQ